jgi:F0F1-type ATP synthase assembly protein I
VPEEQPPDARELGVYFTLGQVGFEIVVPLIVGLIIDNYAHTSPWFTVSGIILGFVGSITHIVLLTNRQEASRRKNNKRGSGAA